MQNHIDFKNEWEKTKKQMIKLSQEAIALAKKGEEELIKISKKGKLHIDSTTLGLKMEHLYYLIGREYVNARTPSQPTPKMSKLIKEIQELEKSQRSLQGKLKKKAAKKTTAKKKTAVKKRSPRKKVSE